MEKKYYIIFLLCHAIKDVMGVIFSITEDWLCKLVFN